MNTQSNCTDDRIREAFDRLIADGQRILNGRPYHQDGHRGLPGNVDYTRFRTEALNLVRRACGDDCDHYAQLRQIAEGKETATNSFYVEHCFGIVQAASNDYANGLLFDLRALVAAEVLGDFIEQAETLLGSGYVSAAASLTGAVLEDSLRKLCKKHGIAVPESTTINGLNTELYRANIYTNLVQKRITALADIRNNADHGHPDKFKDEDVEDMIRYVRKFAEEHLR